MRREELVWTAAMGWHGIRTASRDAGLLHSGARAAPADGACHRGLQAAHPEAVVIGRSTGGWDAFGPSRRVTRSTGDTLQGSEGTPGEVEAVAARRPAGTRSFGFHFPGKTAPHPVPDASEPHNQTMAVTLIPDAA